MKTLLILVIRFYQLTISPLLPANTCRFYPSCSSYAVDALRKYGTVKGLWRAMCRVGRCHPFRPGGYDPA
jgi:putative membrane protein insertion efficiency factor